MARGDARARRLGRLVPPRSGRSSVGRAAQRARTTPTRQPLYTTHRPLWTGPPSPRRTQRPQHALFTSIPFGTFGTVIFGHCVARSSLSLVGAAAQLRGADAIHTSKACDGPGASTSSAEAFLIVLIDGAPALKHRRRSERSVDVISIPVTIHVERLFVRRLHG